MRTSISGEKSPSPSDLLPTAAARHCLRLPIDESCQLWLPVSFDAKTETAKMLHVEQWDPCVLEEQARPADAMVDSIGVNIHLAYTDTSYRYAKAKHDLDVPPQPVVVRFDRPIRQAKAFLPLHSARALREFPAADRLAIEVPDHVLVLEITP